MHPTHRIMVANLEKLLASGDLTPADMAQPCTVLCIVAKTPHGIAYEQTVFDLLPDDLKSLFANEKKGFEAGGMKLVGIFDLWEPAFIKPKPTVKIFNN